MKLRLRSRNPRSKSQAVRELQPNHQFSEHMAAQGVEVFTILELQGDSQSAEMFRDLVADAKESHGPLGACLHAHEIHEYRGMRLFVDEDGTAGFALKSTEVVSVFSHRNRPKRNAARTLMKLATALGGTLLNAIDTALPYIYALNGFWPVARLAWDDREAPADWDFRAMADYNDGKPDVVCMAHTDRHLPVRYVESFEEGVALQESVIEAEFREVEP